MSVAYTVPTQGYNVAYNVQGAGAVGSGSSYLTIPNQPSYQIQTIGMQPQVHMIQPGAVAYAQPPPGMMYGPPPGPMVAAPQPFIVNQPGMGTLLTPSGQQMRLPDQNLVTNKQDALTAEAAVEVKRTRLVAEAEANEALGKGLEGIENQNQVFIRRDPNVANRLRILAFNKLVMYFANRVETAGVLKGHLSCCCNWTKAEYWAPTSYGKSYSVGVVDSVGKEVVTLRRYVAFRHNFQKCCRCINCWNPFLLCLICARRKASCWNPIVVGEIEMPSGTPIAKIVLWQNHERYCLFCCCPEKIERMFVYTGREIDEMENEGYYISMPAGQISQERSAVYQLFRGGNRSIGRIERQIDPNTLQYQMNVVYPAYDVSDQLHSQNTMVERGVLMGAALFIEHEFPEFGATGVVTRQKDLPHVTPTPYVAPVSYAPTATPVPYAQTATPVPYEPSATPVPYAPPMAPVPSEQFVPPEPSAPSVGPLTIESPEDKFTDLRANAMIDYPKDENEYANMKQGVL